jgi:hypothetical protein
MMSDATENHKNRVGSCGYELVSTDEEARKLAVGTMTRDEIDASQVLTHVKLRSTQSAERLQTTMVRATSLNKQRSGLSRRITDSAIVRNNTVPLR